MTFGYPSPHAASRRVVSKSMGATMPFSKYGIDPEQIEAMRAAFYRVCGILHLDGDADDPMTEIVVMKIVALAKAEELDPEGLCIAVLAALDDDDAARAHAAAGSPAPPQFIGGRT